jgi:Co/Zn/Cd efflux system component
MGSPPSLWLLNVPVVTLVLEVTMRRSSIRTLMLFVVFSAIGLAALRNANELWATMMILTALLAVGIAILGTIFLRGREQAWSTGFALFAGGYLVFTLTPSLSSQLGTTHLLDHLRTAMFASAAEPLSDDEARAFSLNEEALTAQLAKLKTRIRNFDHDPAAVAVALELKKTQRVLAANKNAGPRSDHFHAVGDSLQSLLAGLVGGIVAVWLHARR